VLLLNGLNESQRAAVTSSAPVILTLAGAGSGKTTVLTRRVAYLHQEKRIGTSNMLCLTFTRLAGKEMKERVMKLVGEREGKKLFCNTFHSFAVSVLREWGHKLGIEPSFTIYDEEDQTAIIKTIINEQKRKCKPEEVKHDLQLLEGSEGDFCSSESEQVAREYAFRLKQNNAVNLNSLILLVVMLWRQADISSYYRSQYPYVFVDEFQDTSADQMEMIKLLNPDNLFVVGDDFQAIYGWREARIEYILNFPGLYPDCEVIKLEDNYRSTHSIVEAANNLISHNQHQTKKKLVAHKEGPEINITENFDDEYDEAKYVIDRIAELQKSGFPLQEIAVLARTNNQIDRIKNIMDEKKIPALRVSGSGDPFKKRDVRLMLAWLDFYNNRRDNNTLRKILNFPKPYFSPLELKKLELTAMKKDLSLLDAIESSENTDFSKDLAELDNRIAADQAYKPSECLKSLVRALKLEEIYSQKGLENRRMEVERAYSYMLSWEGSTEALGEHNGLSAFLKWLRYKDIQEKLIWEQNTVRLMTVHAAKGLEFSTVFVIGMVQDIFPSKRTEDFEEERRLFYVACTRAKENLNLLCSKTVESWSGEQKPAVASQFLQELFARG